MFGLPLLQVAKYAAIVALVLGVIFGIRHTINVYNSALERAAKAEAQLVQEKTKFASFEAQVRADGERAKANVERVKTDSQRITNEKVNDYESRLASINSAYAGLRNNILSGSSNSGNGVPSLSSAANSVPTDCREESARTLARVEAGVLAILQTGDIEIEKFKALWKRDSALSTIQVNK